jgi:hypothetical protein
MFVDHSGIFAVDAMTDDLDAPATVGHNQPPPDSPIERAGALVANANLWLTTVEEINDADRAGRAQIFVNQLRENRADLDAARKKEREPFDLEIALIKSNYMGPDRLTGIALQKLLALLKPWLDKEKKRIDDEQAARQAEAKRAEADAEALRKAAATAADPVEAELRARDAAEAAKQAARAASRKPERAQIKSDLAPRAMTLKTTWHAEVTDESQALRSFAKNQTFRTEALEIAKRLAGNLARSAKSESAAPSGFRFFKKETPT